MNAIYSNKLTDPFGPLSSRAFQFQVLAHSSIPLVNAPLPRWKGDLGPIGGVCDQDADPGGHYMKMHPPVDCGVTAELPESHVDVVLPRGHEHRLRLPVYRATVP